MSSIDLSDLDVRNTAVKITETGSYPCGAHVPLVREKQSTKLTGTCMECHISAIKWNKIKKEDKEFWSM